MITYSIITSTPEVSYSSVLSTIRCHAVTAGQHAGSTYVEWSANFSSDANAGESSALAPLSLYSLTICSQRSSPTPSTSVSRPCRTLRRLLPRLNGLTTTKAYHNPIADVQPSSASGEEGFNFIVIFSEARAKQVENDDYQLPSSEWV